MLPYTPSDAEQKLLDAYEDKRKNPVIGFDGIPDVHLQALNAVASMVEQGVRDRTLAEAGAAPEVGPLLDVADAASILLFFVDSALKNEGRALRAESKLVAAKLHGLLDAAGYTARCEYTGHRERPGFPVLPSKFLD